MACHGLHVWSLYINHGLPHGYQGTRPCSPGHMEADSCMWLPRDGLGPRITSFATLVSHGHLTAPDGPWGDYGHLVRVHVEKDA